MDVDIDANDGGEDYIMELSDERFALIVFILKTAFAAVSTTLRCLSIGEEILLGHLSSGSEVWVTRDNPDGYVLAVGDRDGKDVSYTVPHGDPGDICDVQPA